MSLLTVQRTPSECRTHSLFAEDRSEGGEVTGRKKRSIRKVFNTVKFINRLRFSENYLTIKGAALILPRTEKTKLRSRRKSRTASNDTVHQADLNVIHHHLQSMVELIRSEDTIQVAIKVESSCEEMVRYLALVVTRTQDTPDTQEGVIIGFNLIRNQTIIGLILPIYQSSEISCNGDGGFRVTTGNRPHIFKPVSIQAMWSAITSLEKVCIAAQANRYLPNGQNHQWVSYYRNTITKDESIIAEWDLTEDLMSTRQELAQQVESRDGLELQIRTALRSLVYAVDLENVTTYEIRMLLEKSLNVSLKPYRPFIDQEVLLLVRQLDASSEILPYLYLGSEWNAGNLAELRNNGIGYILNMTIEIDNFYPGTFKYKNIREYDLETVDLMKYWESTYKFICKARDDNSKVLVHCKMGISRSASTVIAFIMKDTGKSLSETIEYVKSQRAVINPNDGFRKQLETYEGILNASKQRMLFSPAVTLRNTENTENSDTTACDATLCDAMSCDMAICNEDPAEELDWSRSGSNATSAPHINISPYNSESDSSNYSLDSINSDSDNQLSHAYVLTDQSRSSKLTNQKRYYSYTVNVETIPESLTSQISSTQLTQNSTEPYNTESLFNSVHHTLNLQESPTHHTENHTNITSNTDSNEQPDQHEQPEQSNSRLNDEKESSPPPGCVRRKIDQLTKSCQIEGPKFGEANLVDDTVVPGRVKEVKEVLQKISRINAVTTKDKVLTRSNSLREKITSNSQPKSKRPVKNLTRSASLHEHCRLTDSVDFRKSLLKERYKKTMAQSPVHDLAGRKGSSLDIIGSDGDGYDRVSFKIGDQDQDSDEDQLQKPCVKPKVRRNDRIPRADIAGLLKIPSKVSVINPCTSTTSMDSSFSQCDESACCSEARGGCMASNTTHDVPLNLGAPLSIRVPSYNSDPFCQPVGGHAVGVSAINRAVSLNEVNSNSQNLAAEASVDPVMDPGTHCEPLTIQISSYNSDIFSKPLTNREFNRSTSMTAVKKDLNARPVYMESLSADMDPPNLNFKQPTIKSPRDQLLQTINNLTVTQHVMSTEHQS